MSQTENSETKNEFFEDPYKIRGQKIRQRYVNKKFPKWAEFINCTFDNRDVPGYTKEAGFATPFFYYSSLHNVNMSGSKFDLVEFSEVDLTGACFVGTELKNTTFNCTTIEDVDWRGAKFLENTDLRGAKISVVAPELWEGASGDNTAYLRLPEKIQQALKNYTKIDGLTWKIIGTTLEAKNQTKWHKSEANKQKINEFKFPYSESFEAASFREDKIYLIINSQGIANPYNEHAFDEIQRGLSLWNKGVEPVTEDNVAALTSIPNGPSASDQLQELIRQTMHKPNKEKIKLFDFKDNKEIDTMHWTPLSPDKIYLIISGKTARPYNENSFRELNGIDPYTKGPITLYNYVVFTAIPNGLSALDQLHELMEKVKTEQEKEAKTNSVNSPFSSSSSSTSSTQHTSIGSLPIQDPGLSQDSERNIQSSSSISSQGTSNEPLLELKRSEELVSSDFSASSLSIIPMENKPLEQGQPETSEKGNPESPLVPKTPHSSSENSTRSEDKDNDNSLETLISAERIEGSLDGKEVKNQERPEDPKEDISPWPHWLLMTLYVGTRVVIGGQIIGAGVAGIIYGIPYLGQQFNSDYYYPKLDHVQTVVDAHESLKLTLQVIACIGTMILLALLCYYLGHRCDKKLEECASALEGVRYGPEAS